MDVQAMVPDFTFTATNQFQGKLTDLRGQWLVLFFYPKDSTPGCTIESRDFRDAQTDFSTLNTLILGISRDSLSSHENFKQKQMLSFELISDSEEKLCELFDVMRIKSMYGKKFRGIERSTFLIDPEGRLRHSWRKVKVIGHVQEVKSTLLQLQKE